MSLLLYIHRFNMLHLYQTVIIFLRAYVQSHTSMLKRELIDDKQNNPKVLVHLIDNMPTKLMQKWTSECKL